jgi:hypothetical protein
VFKHNTGKVRTGVSVLVRTQGRRSLKSMKSPAMGLVTEQAPPNGAREGGKALHTWGEAAFVQHSNW